MRTEGLSAADIARQAVAENIVLALGNVFSPAQTTGRFLRFNVAQCADPCASGEHRGGIGLCVSFRSFLACTSA